MTDTARTAELETVLSAIRACRRCVEAPHGKPLPHEPRPVLRASSTARLAVCSQAPGTKVHASGTPFTDRSGDRLRDWMGVTPPTESGVCSAYSTKDSSKLRCALVMSG